MKRIIALITAVMMITACATVTHAAEIGTPYAEPIRESGISATGAARDISPTGESSVPKIEIDTENGNGASLEKAVLFKVRGNSTAMTHVTKKAFTFKFDKKNDVLGMGRGKKWALLANCFDPTLLRNYAVFALARELDLPYTSEQRFAELWLDGAYRGCYTVYEPIQAGKDRVDIDVEGNSGKKDFMLELEATREEDDTTYLSVGGLRFAFSEPEEPDDGQIDYVTQIMTDIINTLKTGSEDEIRQKIDVSSFAAYYLLNEYAKTADFGFSSVFFFYKDGRLYAGPPWDYDLALGNLNGDLNSASAKQGSRSDGIMQKDKSFYRWLCAKDWFMNEVKRVYVDHYDYIANISADGGLLDSLREEYGGVFARNFTVWKVNRWWLNYQRPPLQTYEDNYQLLKNWCAERNSWLTGYYGLYRYTYRRGDADDSGTVNIFDVTLIQRVLAHIQEDDGGIALRSALSGRELSVFDVTCIQRYIARMDDPMHVGEEASVMRY